jgi:hypothetical protein
MALVEVPGERIDRTTEGLVIGGRVGWRAEFPLAQGLGDPLASPSTSPRRWVQASLRASSNCPSSASVAGLRREVGPGVEVGRP